MSPAKASGLAALLWLSAAFAPAVAETGVIPPADRPAAATVSLLAEVWINGSPAPDLAMIRIRSEGCDEIEAAPLRAAGLVSGAEVTVCLQSLTGVSYDLDPSSARVDIYAESLLPETGRGRAAAKSYAPSLSGVIGQYGVSVQRVEDASGTYESAFADMSATLHAGWGRLQNDEVAAWDGSGLEVRRLATTYERDFPDNMARLVVGDSFSRAPRWGRLSAIAGVQYGTDFSMDPDQAYRPYRTFRALLRQQSEIDVRVNGALRERASFEPGYGDVQISPEAGLNEVEIAIRDGTGLTRVEDISFFASQDGLAAGVTDYSVSAGVPRRFDGLRSEYGDTPVASGLIRRGLSDSLTLEAHGEIGRGVALIGAGAQLAADRIGVLNLSAGISEGGSGVVAAGFERNTRRASLQFQARLADKDYVDLASAAGTGFPDLSLRASAGVFTAAGSFRASYSEQRDKILPDRRFASAGWEKAIAGNRFVVSASGFHDLERDETGFSISLRINSGRYSSRISRDRTAGSSVSAVEISRSRLSGERIQWSVQGAQGNDTEAVQGSLQVDLGAAEAFVHAGRFSGTSEVSGGVRGGFTLLAGKTSLSRQTTQATALVRAGGIAGLAIYQDNRKVAVTDADGNAMIAGVRPFEVNRLSLRPEDVPLDFSVASFDLDFIPLRGISDVGFGVRRESALAFTVVHPDGTPIAPGSRVRLAGSGDTCPVGLDGRVFCAAADDAGSVIVEVPGGTYSEPVSRLRRTGRMELGPPSGHKYAEAS